MLNVDVAIHWNPLRATVPSIVDHPAVSTRRPLVTRVVGRAARTARSALGEVIKAVASRRVRRAMHRLPPLREPAPLDDRLRMVLSNRVANEDRLRLLSVVLARLSDDLATEPPAITVRDASDEPLLSQARQRWEATGLPVEHLAVHEPMLTAFRTVAESAAEPYLTFQFDDTLTAGLRPAYLRAACTLLDRWRGVVDIVTPPWSLATELDEGRRVVRVISHELVGARYRFTASRPRRPLAIETVAGLRFGIFENPTYGFFFNHMVVPREDYLRRVRWFEQHVSATSVHAIEVAAEHGLRGPTWRHAAICLDGISLLDLDYAHTGAALRHERPDLVQLVERLEDGWELEVVSRER